MPVMKGGGFLLQALLGRRRSEGSNTLLPWPCPRSPAPACAVARTARSGLAGWQCMCIHAHAHPSPVRRRPLAPVRREGYRDAFLTAHFEVPGEMFTLAMEAKRSRGMGVVGSTSNILDFIAAK